MRKSNSKSGARGNAVMTESSSARPTPSCRDNFGSCIGAYINAVYYRQSLARRASRFPWFRDDEPFVALDATVTYASESRLPAMRAALDAPRAFVVFALREPVARAFSDFRFCYRPYFFSQDIGFDAATLGALDAYDACYGAARAFYAANRTAAADAAGADAYYGLACQDLKLRRRDPFGLVRKSLYVYQVLHYRAVHGAERVTAVSAEQLKRDAPGAGRAVAAHVGLCASFSFGAGQRVHATRARVAPRHAWSRAGYRRLRAWFEPYNRRLYAALRTTESSLGWEEVDYPSFRDDRLPT